MIQKNYNKLNLNILNDDEKSILVFSLREGLGAEKVLGVAS